MGYIFIAHVEEDADIALGIALGLEEAGYRTWCYELDSIVGASYIVRTGEAVAQSDALAVIISPHSLGSVQVTKEVVRAHESGRHFLPILRGISHVEFQQRQPEWREAIGSATSIRAPKEGMGNLVPSIIEGIKALRIKPAAAVDASRVKRIREEINEISGGPITQEKAEAAGPVTRNESRRPVFWKPLRIILPSILLIGVVITGILLFQGKDDTKKEDTLSSGNVTITTAPASIAPTTQAAVPAPTTVPPAQITTAPPVGPATPESNYLQRGIALLAEEKYEQAIVLFDLAIDLEPDNPDAYLNRAYAHYYSGQYDMAISDFTRTIELDSDNASAYNFRGDSYLYKNDYDEAIVNFNKAIQISPNYSSAYNDRACAFYYKGEYEKAIEDLTKAIEIEPYSAYFRNFRGWVYMISEDYYSAIEDFNKTLEIDPFYDAAYLNRGKCNKALGNIEEAIVDFNKCIEVSQDPSMVEEATKELRELQ